MRKLDKIGRVLYVVLWILYIPLSFFSWLMPMASETTIGVTNRLYIVLIDIFCVISWLIPFLVLVALALSRFFRTKDYHMRAFVVQLVPLAVFILNMLLLVLAGAIVK